MLVAMMRAMRSSRPGAGPPPAMISRRRLSSRRVSLDAPCAASAGFGPGGVFGFLDGRSVILPAPTELAVECDGAILIRPDYAPASAIPSHCSKIRAEF